MPMVPQPAKQPQDDRAQVRLVSIVLVATMGGWLLLQMIGGAYDWPPRFIFLVDLAALAGFLFALIVTYRIWRARKG
jgi:hypothetical protein